MSITYKELKEFNKTLEYPWVIESHGIYQPQTMLRSDGWIIKGRFGFDHPENADYLLDVYKMMENYKLTEDNDYYYVATDIPDYKLTIPKKDERTR